MGIQERDWYREEHADKNGMRYNKKNATYSVKEVPLTASNSAEFLPRSPIVKASPHWSLQLAVWLVVAVALAIFYRYSR